jgi:hypothetical protein
MRSLYGELGPADFARVWVTGRRVKLESMTWCFFECSGYFKVEDQELEIIQVGVSLTTGASHAREHRQRTRMTE